MKYAWDQDEEIMGSTWIKQEIYIKRACDLHEGIMGYNEENIIFL